MEVLSTLFSDVLTFGGSLKSVFQVRLSDFLKKNTQSGQLVGSQPIAIMLEAPRPGKMLVQNTQHRRVLDQALALGGTSACGTP